MDVLETTADENAHAMLVLLRDYLEDQSEVPMYLDKMATEYMAVHNVQQLEVGRYVRWICDGKMTRGGFVVGAPAADRVMCKTAHNRIVQFQFDECPCFHKLNLFEQWYMLHNGKKAK